MDHHRKLALSGKSIHFLPRRSVGRQSEPVRVDLYCYELELLNAMDKLLLVDSCLDAGVEIGDACDPVGKRCVSP
jgi:hypothetical protein